MACCTSRRSSPAEAALAAECPPAFQAGGSGNHSPGLSCVGVLSGAGVGALGNTCGVSIGRIAPDSGRGVGIAGWRGNGCAVGRGAGGAANNDGVTGSGLGAAGAIGWTGGVATAAGGNGDGVDAATFD